jgi:hypothetical protein
MINELKKKINKQNKQISDLNKDLNKSVNDTEKNLNDLNDNKLDKADFKKANLTFEYLVSNKKLTQDTCLQICIEDDNNKDKGTNLDEVKKLLKDYCTLIDFNLLNSEFGIFKENEIKEILN